MQKTYSAIQTNFQKEE